MLTRIQKILLYCMYLTLGTYAVPFLRLKLGFDFDVPYAVVFALAIAVLLIVEILLRRKPISISNRLVGTAFIYLFSIIISLFFAQVPEFQLSFKYALFFLSPLLVVLVADHPQTIKLALLCLWIGSLAVFVYGAYGYFSGDIGDPIQHTLGYFGVTYKDSTRNGDMLYFQTAFWISVSLYLFGNSKWQKPVWFGLTAVVAASLVMGLARGAWVSTGVAFLFVLWRSGKVNNRGFLRTVVILTLFASGLVGIFLLLGAERVDLIVSRSATLFTLSSDYGNSNQNRLALILRAFDVVPYNPFGVGVGNAGYFLIDLLGFGAWFENGYLQLVVEQGILGLVAFVGLLVWIASRVMRYTLAIRLSSTDEWVGWALLGITVDWSIFGLFNVMHQNMWFWSVLGLAMAWGNRVVFDLRRQSAEVSRLSRNLGVTNAPVGGMRNAGR